MYLTADKVTLDDDDGRFTLEVEDDEGRRYAFLIHHIDLDAFYAQVKGRLGPYLNERDEVLRTFRCNPDESGGYDVSDPKHPEFHSVHADIWDAREGK